MNWKVYFKSNDEILTRKLGVPAMGACPSGEGASLSGGLSAADMKHLRLSAFSVLVLHPENISEVPSPAMMTLVSEFYLLIYWPGLEFEHEHCSSSGLPSRRNAGTEKFLCAQFSLGDEGEVLLEQGHVCPS